jgi:phage FluMu gp28-like protein
MKSSVEFLPYQSKWIADPAQVKVCEKSRRIGLTWCEAADRALSAASSSGMDTWYIGYNKDMALEFVETASWWARHFDRVAREIEEIAMRDQGARYPRVSHPLRLGPQNRRALVASLQPARQAGLRRDR